MILVAACGCAATGPPPLSPAAPAPSPAPPDGLAGLASWYGPRHHGRPTASGAPYDMYAMSAAHRTLPLGARVRVTNLDNGRAVVVRITDRGPYTRDRVIDVSYAAAEALGLLERGVAPVRLEVLSPPE